MFIVSTFIRFYFLSAHKYFGWLCGKNIYVELLSLSSSCLPAPYDNNMTTSRRDETEWKSKIHIAKVHVTRSKIWMKFPFDLYEIHHLKWTLVVSNFVKVKNVFNCFAFEWVKIIFLSSLLLKHQVHVELHFCIKMSSSTSTVVC